MNEITFSILMPTYNGADYIAQTLKSILSQSFTDYEIIINDDNSQDTTEDVVKSFHEERIKFYKNTANLGYPRNLEECRKKACGDIIYLMGHDDILGKDALLNTYEAFKMSEDIGAVTRPYYWFDKNITFPVRAKDQLSPNQNEIVTINDDYERIISMFRTLDQLSGLAYRRKFIDLPFHEDIFPCHVYPFASIFKKHAVVFLKDYNIAVRISSSQSRSVSSIYNRSPLETWVDMFNQVFHEEKFRKFKNYCIKNFVARNYIGLVQIRNYSKFGYLIREIRLLLKYRIMNIFSFSFWFFSLGCIVMPPTLLIPLVDWYKNRINYKRIKEIRFEYKID